MTKFYTNIDVRGNTILYRGYEDGIPVQEKIEYSPHLFVKTTEPSPYKVFKSEIPVKKRNFSSIKEMKEFIESYNEVPNFGLYGCKNIVRQFTGNMYRQDIDWDYSLTQIWFFDIETEVEGKGFPHPDKAEERILLISMINHFTQELHIWSLKPISKDNRIFTEFKNVKVHCFDNDEKGLLKDFLMFFASTRIDVLSGWNSESFDIPYIVNRIRIILGEESIKYLSPWRIVKPRSFHDANDKLHTTYDIIGITHLDYLDVYKKFNPGGKESFKLGYIAEIELGETKVELPGESFRENYLNHWENFVFYSATDSALLHKLELKLLQVRLAMQLAFIAKCQFGDVLSAMRLWESIIYNYFLDENVVEELDKESNEKHSIVGAYVHPPKPGKYGWSVSLDFTSLYPCIIMQNNISTETIVDYIDIGGIDGVMAGNHVGKVPNNCIISANGLITSKNTKGFIPILIQRMFDLRKSTKKLMLDKKKEEQEILARIKELEN